MKVIPLVEYNLPPVPWTGGASDWRKWRVSITPRDRFKWSLARENKERLYKRRNSWHFQVAIFPVRSIQSATGDLDFSFYRATCANRWPLLLLRLENWFAWNSIKPRRTASLLVIIIISITYPLHARDKAPVGPPLNRIFRPRSSQHVRIYRRIYATIDISDIYSGARYAFPIVLVFPFYDLPLVGRHITFVICTLLVLICAY